MAIQQSVLDWFKGLPTSLKYVFQDEEKLYNDISASSDPFSLLEARQLVSEDILQNVLKKRSRVIMFGAGGTASWFLPKLLKIYNDAFYKLPDLKYELEIIILDNDVIEPKNIVRQNFINEDVGENKAIKLAERYNGLYPNINVVAIPLYATSMEYDTKISKLEEPLDPEVFFNIDDFLQSSDIIVNLVDNEVFKRKLDFVIYRRSALLYFNAGINLYNGQCYVAYPQYSNLYTIDHPSFIDDVEEVKIHSCADADAEGTEDNPEQMFNGNDLAASLLANMYQTAITEAITHRKHKFICGNNISITKELPTYSSVVWAPTLNPNKSYPYEEAKDFIAQNGLSLRTEEAQAHYKLVRAIDAYQNIPDIMLACDPYDY